MNQYFSLVFAVGFAAAVAGFISYDGGRSMALRSAIGVVILLVVISPVSELMSEASGGSLPELPSWDGELSDKYEETAREAVEEGIRELLAKEYSLDKESFAVRLEGFRFSSMKAEMITVTLYGKAAFCDPLAVEDLVEQCGIGECYAKIGI